jgi:hypothetical protein
LLCFQTSAVELEFPGVVAGLYLSLATDVFHVTVALKLLMMVQMALNESLHVFLKVRI